MRKLFVICALLLCSSSLAQESAPAVDKFAVIRHGDFVQQLGDFFAGADNAIAEALAPPEDDSHKWFITIITKDSCPWCETLKKDFQQSEYLRAWVNDSDLSRAWAHYMVYRWEDETQKWRWKNLDITGFPTILIQPPRNGQYGPTSTVVAKLTGYDGNPEKLSNKLSAVIKEYIRRYQQPRQSQVGVIGGPTSIPFEPGPKVIDPRTPTGPFIDIPPGPRAATFEELMAAIPEAPPDFLLEQVRQQATLEVAKANWERLRPLPLVPAPYAPRRSGSFVALLLLVSWGLLLFLGYRWVKNERAKALLARKEEEARKLALEVANQQRLDALNKLLSDLSAKGAGSPTPPNAS